MSKDLEPKIDVKNELRLLHQRIEELGAAVASRGISNRAEDIVKLASEVSDAVFYDQAYESGRFRLISGLDLLLGYSQEEVPLTRDWWWEQVHPEDRRTAEARFAQLIDSDGEYRSVYRVRSKGGRYITVEERARIRSDFSNPLKSIMGCIKKANPRRADEGQLLKVQGKEFRQPPAILNSSGNIGLAECLGIGWNSDPGAVQETLDHIPAMVFLYRREEFLFLNQEALSTIGISAREEVKNADVLSRWCPDPRDRRKIWDAMTTEASGWREFKVAVRNGKEIRMAWANRALSGGFYIAVGIDITQRTEAEEELKLYAQTLESINQDLQDFASIASHDLQDPLRKIRVFGEMAAAKWGESEEAREYLARIQNAAARMQRLLDSLQTYSRVSAKDACLSDVDLRKQVGEALSNLEIQIKETGAKFEVDALPKIEADGAQLTQLFQNLIGNALKFRRQDKTPNIKIRVRSIKQGGSWKAGALEIHVEDNGIGFDQNQLERIFAPFQRLHGREEYEGAGMGLAICKKIVERHGGRITARSALGRGSTFIVTLPKRRSET